MLKRIGIALLVMLSILPAAAQENAQTSTTWSFSLYEQTVGKVTQVSSNGQVAAEYVLPLPEDFDTYNYDAVMSETGQYIAYVVSEVGDGSDPVQSSRVMVYDTTSGEITATYDLNPGVIREGINVASTSLTFDNTGTRLFVGYYVPVADADNEWTQEFVVLDVVSGEVVNTLTGDMVASAGAVANAPYRPKVISFVGDAVTVLLYPIFQQMSPDNVVFTWNTATNEVAEAPAELTTATDYAAATGETLVLSYDESIDALAEGETRVEGMLIPANTVQLYNMETGETTPVFAQDISIISAEFVQNDERILVFADAGARGILLERDGTVVTEFQNLPGDMLTSGVPAGFIYADPQQSQTIMSVRTFEGDFTPQVLYTPQGPFNMLAVQEGRLPDMGG
jgi:hypothetical protein